MSLQWVKKHSNCKRDVYQFSPLNRERLSIRIVELLPGYPPEELKCRLFRTTIYSGVQYKALSYTWGNHRKQDCLTVNGCCLPITKNLFDALIELRSKTKPRLLWIDAICIDQESTAERNHQVLSMSSIYSNADEVIVWLGPTVEKWRCKCYLFEFSCQCARSYCTKTSDPLWLSLLHSPWFERAWVLQEVVHARKIVIRFGGTKTNWRLLVGLANYIQKYPHPLGRDSRCLDAAKRISYMEKWRRLDPWRLRIEDIVFNARTSLCEKPEDRIHSTLSLAPREDGKLLFDPDYRLDYAQVLVKFTKAVIQDSSSLNILRYVDHPTYGIVLPSWVSRFRRDQPHPLPVEYDSSLDDLPNVEVCRFLKLSTPSPVDGVPRLMNILSIQGCFVSRILCTGGVISHETDASIDEPIDEVGQHAIVSDKLVQAGRSKDFNHTKIQRLRTSVPIPLQDREIFGRYLGSRRQSYASHSPTTIEARPILEPLDHHHVDLSILNHNLISLGVFPKAYTSIIRSKVSFPILKDVRDARREKLENVDYMRKPSLSSTSSVSSTSSAGLAFPALANGRRIALTGAEIYALVPSATRSGDLIAAFCSIRLLFVMRPYFVTPNDTQLYVMIGPCEIEEELCWEAFEEEGARVNEIYIC